jgi:hypothetical protein
LCRLSSFVAPPSYLGYVAAVLPAILLMPVPTRTMVSLLGRRHNQMSRRTDALASEGRGLPSSPRWNS